jgi:saxitoxin biosynthesis operon SxtJ-like protein
MIAINRHPSNRQLWWFAGLWLPLAGATAGRLLLWRAHTPRAAMAVWIATAIATAASLVNRAMARGVFVVLSYVTFPIGFFVSWIALALLYFVVVTPLAVVMRLIGRDPLSLSRNDTTSSYWRERDGETGDRSRAFRQF